ncbi:hypothetical protein ABPG74_002042 [Tetrahymena malaccensis]
MASNQERHILLILGVNYIKSSQIISEVFNLIASFAASLPGVQIPKDQNPVDLPCFGRYLDAGFFSFQLIVDTKQNDKIEILNQIKNHAGKLNQLEIISEIKYKVEKEDLDQSILNNVEGQLENLYNQTNKLSITQQQMEQLQSQINVLQTLSLVSTFHNIMKDQNINQSNKCNEKFQGQIINNEEKCYSQNQKQAEKKSTSYINNHNSTEKKEAQNQSEEICQQQLIQVQQIEMKSKVKNVDENDLLNCSRMINANNCANIQPIGVANCNCFEQKYQKNKINNSHKVNCIYFINIVNNQLDELKKGQQKENYEDFNQSSINIDDLVEGLNSFNFNEENQQIDGIQQQKQIEIYEEVSLDQKQSSIDLDHIIEGLNSFNLNDKKQQIEELNQKKQITFSTTIDNTMEVIGNKKENNITQSYILKTSQTQINTNNIQKEDQKILQQNEIQQKQGEDLAQQCYQQKEIKIQSQQNNIQFLDSSSETNNKPNQPIQKKVNQLYKKSYLHKLKVKNYKITNKVNKYTN